MFNLANPRPLRLQRLFFIARLELLITCCCVVLSLFFLWQLTKTSVPLTLPASTQQITSPPVSHPLAEQMALWQLIQNNDSDELKITHIEYTGSIWHLQLTSRTNSRLHHWLNTITGNPYLQRWELNSLHQREDTLFAQVTIYP